jgi:hypothetical protein
MRAAIGPIDGKVTFVIAILFCILVLLLSIFTVQLQGSAGEILPRFGGDFDTILRRAHTGKGGKSAWFRPSHRRPQLLTMIITDNQEGVSAVILKEMGRGVTSISGKGMYTGETHPILLCALTVTEVPHLKSLVAGVDPKAFVIVMPASEVLGYGFQPLGDEEA